MPLFSRSNSILDFGSGLGGNVKYLAGHLKNTRFLLVDHSKRSQEYVEKEVLGNKDDRGNTFEYLLEVDEIPEGSVAMVMAIQVIEHLSQYKQIMDTLWSKLSSGGILLISVPVRGRMDRNRQHVNKFTVGSMFRILSAYGEIVHIAPRTYSKRSGHLGTAYFYVEKES
jgi:cyclopropane fatty-acyl-phospholipid synthase-like methyltransferase